MNTSDTMSSSDNNHNSDNTTSLAISTTGGAADAGRRRQLHTYTSTSTSNNAITSTITLTHMPNEIVIHILSCLPTLHMIRIRSTCKLLNKCSKHGGAWRYSLNKIDEEYKGCKLYYKSKGKASEDYDRISTLFPRVKRCILSESMRNIHPRPMLQYLNTRYSNIRYHISLDTYLDRFDPVDDIICKVLECYGGTLQHVMLRWPSSETQADRYSTAISHMKSLRYLDVCNSTRYALQEQHMSMICRSNGIQHIGLDWDA
jgi:hypothetical protein